MDGLNKPEICWLIVLQARSAKSSLWQGLIPSETFPSFFLTSGHLLAVFHVPCLVYESFQFFAQTVFYVSVFTWPYKDANYIIQYDLILTNYLCKEPLSKKGHILMH